MTAVSSLPVNNAIEVLLLIFVTFVTRGKGCFWTVNPPIAALTLFLVAEVVNRMLWPTSLAISSGSAAW